MTEEPPERSGDTPERRKLIREAGAQGLTLLKNVGNILPIQPRKKIAMIGPNVKRAIAGGGGSASLKPCYLTTPFEGLQSQVDEEVLYSKGCDTAKWLPLMSDTNLTTPS